MKDSVQLNKRVIRFLFVGTSAAIVNIALMICFVELLSCNTYFFKNIANILSMEVSIFYNFLLSRTWTWGDVPKKQGNGIIVQFMSFNLAALTGILVRVAIFAILDRMGVYYLLNVLLGIGSAAALDFVLYDKLIFRRVRHVEET